MNVTTEWLGHDGDGDGSGLPDEVMFAVIGLRAEALPAADRVALSGGVIAGGVQLKIGRDCDPYLIVEALLSIAESIDASLKRQQARTN